MTDEPAGEATEQATSLRSPLMASLERYQVDLFSKRAILLAVVLVAGLLLARRLPLVPALILCVLVAMPYTTSFWFGIMISRRPMAVRSLGWLALAWAVGIWWWSVATTILWEHDALAFTPDEPSLGTTVLFLLWHLVHLIPLLDVDATLPWARPLGYKSQLVGASVLGYEALVVLPVIGLVRRAITRPPAQQSA